MRHGDYDTTMNAYVKAVPESVQKAMQRISARLAADGKIRHHHSVHDFRHYFAVKLYRETQDVYAIKAALGHATVSVTEVYLAGLGLTDS